MLDQDKRYMKLALELAELAESKGEVPVGAILVFRDEIIGRGYNCPISSNDPTAHAEIIAIREAAKKIGNYRLVETTLYVTLEPCIMCAGAIIHARIKRLIFGACDYKAGAAGSVFDIFEEKKLNYTVIVEKGLMGKESEKLLKEFFKKRR